MNRINEKIIEIEKLLEELRSIFPIDFKNYIDDWKIRDICERHFEKIVEAVVDISFLIIGERKFESPKDDQNAFDILFNNKIISKELSLKLKDAKGMRNIIAHEYGKVEDELVFEAITEELEKDVKEFIKSIENI